MRPLRIYAGLHINPVITFVLMNNPTQLNLDGLPANALDAVRELTDQVIRLGGLELESFVLTGSILTEDYMPGVSDINSIIVVSELKAEFLDGLAGLGKKMGKKKVRSPLVITEEYMERSFDVFPIEFLEIILIHKTVYGREMFDSIEIDRQMLRLQCERELKAKLIQLSRGYISASGDSELLLNMMIQASSGFYPLLRSVLYMTGRMAPTSRHSVISSIESQSKIKLDGLRDIQSLRSQKKPHLKPRETKELYFKLYAATQELSLFVDEIRL